MCLSKRGSNRKGCFFFSFRGGIKSYSSLFYIPVLIIPVSLSFLGGEGVAYYLLVVASIDCFLMVYLSLEISLSLLILLLFVFPCFLITFLSGVDGCSYPASIALILFLRRLSCYPKCLAVLFSLCTLMRLLLILLYSTLISLQLIIIFVGSCANSLLFLALFVILFFVFLYQSE